MIMKLFPTAFIGHGNPMNALADNLYTQKLRDWGRRIPKPELIVCISAHWLTNGTYITHMAQPKTIHDFYGFPEPLFQVQYPAKGSPIWAEKIAQALSTPKIKLDHDWGLDHGTWSVLKHVYPDADIPVIQLSIDIKQPPLFHYSIGQKLQFLRRENVLILGSGNIVHNLKKIEWQKEAAIYSWATEFDNWVKDRLLVGDHSALIHDHLNTESGRLSVSTADHWYPLLYVLGAADTQQKVAPEFIYEGIENASISMRSVVF